MSSGFSFSKNRRLKSGRDFQAVFSASRYYREGFCLKDQDLYIYVKRSEAGEASRLGLSVSKKVAKRAHDRNRIKRCIREAFRLSQWPSGFDFIFRFVGKEISVNRAFFENKIDALKKTNKFNKLSEF